MPAADGVDAPPELAGAPARRAATRPAETPDILVRRAIESDEPAIRRFLQRQGAHTRGLQWPRFVVALDAKGVVGVVQLLERRAGFRELQSLVVNPAPGVPGVARRMLDRLLVHEVDTVFGIVEAEHVPALVGAGFRRVDATLAPAAICKRLFVARLIGLRRLLQGLPRRRLVLLERPGVRARLQEFG